VRLHFSPFVSPAARGAAVCASRAQGKIFG
jgi:hypothetical protein